MTINLDADILLYGKYLYPEAELLLNKNIYDSRLYSLHNFEFIII